VSDVASQQLSTVMEQVNILNSVLAELKTRLDVQNTNLLGALQAAAAKNDKVDSAVASDAEQAQSPTTSVQAENAGSEYTVVRGDELRKPEAE